MDRTGPRHEDASQFWHVGHWALADGHYGVLFHEGHGASAHAGHGGRCDDTAGGDLGTGDSDPMFGFSYTGGFQTFTVPETGSYAFTALGAGGGTGNARSGDSNDEAAGGGGAMVQGLLNLTAGEVLTIAVGGRGGDSPDSIGAAGGGGGTFVVASGGELLLVAGGGGGGAVGGHEAQSEGVSASQAATAGKSASFIPGESVAGGAAGSDGKGGEAGQTKGGGDGHAGGGGFLTDGGNGDEVGNAGHGGDSFAGGLAGGAGGGGNGGHGGFGGGGGGGYLGGGGGGGGYDGGGGGAAVQNVGGGGGAGGSYVIDGAQHVTFAAYPYAVNGSIVFELEPPSAANDPDSVDWAALATHATANLSTDGLWLA